MNIAVIFAGGTGQRMNGGKTPKQFLSLHGKPIIIYTLEIFENHEDIDAIVIACVESWIPHLRELLIHYHITKVKKIVPGGCTGQLSIYNGLTAAEEISLPHDDETVVLIHDGVRPLINESVISDNIACTLKYGNAITTAVVKETILIVNDDDSIDYVPDRSHSRVAKAPQSFILKDILTAHEKAQTDNITDFIDSCTMMQHYGYKLHLIDGPYENIKITSPDDFYTMRALLDAKENAQIYID